MRVRPQQIPCAAQIWTPGGEQVGGLTSGGVAVVEQLGSVDVVGLANLRERGQQGAARPPLRLPVGVVPESRRDEEHAVPICPSRPADRVGHLVAPRAVASAEYDERPPCPALRRLVPLRDSVPNLRRGVVRRPRPHRHVGDERRRGMERDGKTH